MTDQSSTEPPHSLLLYTHAVYALCSAGFIFPALWLIAILITFLKKESAANTWLASHYAWLLKTFLWGTVGLVILAVLTYIMQILVANSHVGGLVYALTGLFYGLGIAWVVWLAYRVARGWALLNMKRPAPLT